MDKNILTPEQYLTIYDIVYTETHSPGFKIAEVRDLLFDDKYGFIEPVRDNWVENLNKALEEFGIDKSQLNMNQALINYYSK